jgi:hypothetical protein
LDGRSPIAGHRASAAADGERDWTPV